MAKEAKSCYIDSAFSERKYPVDLPNCYEDVFDKQQERKFSERKPTFCPSSAKKDYTLENKHKTEEISKCFARKLLMNCPDLEEISPSVLQKLKNLEFRYRKVTEDFSLKMNKWMKSRKRNIELLQKSRQKLHLVHRSTTALTFISSTVDLASSLGFFFQDLFHFNMNSKLPLIFVSVLGGISVTSSLLALSYSKMTLGHISSGISDEKALQRDLEVIYRRGHWIDKAVQDLFPFGIDTKLLKENFLDITDKSEHQQSWRHHVCSAIILTNITEDISILKDENFLATVKAFIESPVAYAWLNRMKLRKLLDEMSNRSGNISEKELISDCEAFLSQAAINVYPVFLPLFLKTGDTEKWRFVCSSITAFIAAKDLADKGEDFQEMKNMSSKLLQEYKKIKKAEMNLIIDYD